MIKAKRYPYVICAYEKNAIKDWKLYFIPFAIQ